MPDFYPVFKGLVKDQHVSCLHIFRRTTISNTLSYHQQKQVFKSYVNKLSKLMRVALNVYSWWALLVCSWAFCSAWQLLEVLRHFHSLNHSDVTEWLCTLYVFEIFPWPNNCILITLYFVLWYSPIWKKRDQTAFRRHKLKLKNYDWLAMACTVRLTVLIKADFFPVAWLAFLHFMTLIDHVHSAVILWWRAQGAELECWWMLMLCCCAPGRTW